MFGRRSPLDERRRAKGEVAFGVYPQKRVEDDQPGDDDRVDDGVNLEATPRLAER
jgi:hypothetical protein